MVPGLSHCGFALAAACLRPGNTSKERTLPLCDSKGPATSDRLAKVLHTWARMLRLSGQGSLTSKLDLRCHGTTLGSLLKGAIDRAKLISKNLSKHMVVKCCFGDIVSKLFALYTKVVSNSMLIVSPGGCIWSAVILFASQSCPYWPTTLSSDRGGGNGLIDVVHCCSQIIRLGFAHLLLTEQHQRIGFQCKEPS